MMNPKTCQLSWVKRKSSVKTLTNKVTLHVLLFLKKQAYTFDDFTHGLN